MAPGPGAPFHPKALLGCCSWEEMGIYSASSSHPGDWFPFRLWGPPASSPACTRLSGVVLSPSPPFSCACRLPFTIFQGGMPRASYGDRHCISVVHNGQQTAFDFTSRVIDFTVLTEADPTAGERA